MLENNENGNQHAENTDHTDEYSPIEESIQYKRRSLEEFKQLTLADTFVLGLRHPIDTWRMLNVLVRTPRVTPIKTDEIAVDKARASVRLKESVPTSEIDTSLEGFEQAEEIIAAPVRNIEEQTVDRAKELLLLGFRLAAFLVVWSGNAMLAIGRPENIGRALVFILVGLAGWLVIEIYARWGKSWWANTQSQFTVQNQSDDTWDAFHPVRIVLAVMGAASMFATFLFTSGNRFTMLGFIAWMASIICFAGVFASDRALFERHAVRLKFNWKENRSTLITLVVIILIGSFFRLANLDRTPPQMTSDHVEKLLDSQRVLDGTPQVFFPNNGGREPLQMYLMALLSQVPGLGMNFFTLKLLSALEGIITLPFLWWMGREIVGQDNRQLGNIVGLVLAGLVAVSGWHVALSRLALRIVLTPIVSAVLLIYLGRAIRFNRRDDYVRAGLILGAGLYMYQAVRMLPVVVIVAVIIGLIANARTAEMFRRYQINFMVLVFLSFVVFVPMFNFSLESPDLFWRRTTGRLLGDAVIQQENPDGTITMRDATVAERFDAFRSNLPVLGNNIRNVVLMFNWKGDVAWINNAPNKPQMDSLVGALFLIGLLAWLIRTSQQRDGVNWLVPLMLFIMLMPSALAIAYPVENPSATRSSGALPAAYLIAAYPLGLMAQSVFRLFNTRIIRNGIAVTLVGVVMLISYVQNAHTYFDLYHDNYLLSSLPYKQAGREIQAFNAETGTYGNTFMIAYPYWWDHRALGIEAGMIDYPNGIVTLGEVPGFLLDSYQRSDKYRLDPDADILFYHSPEDTAALEQLQAWFPDGFDEVTTIEEQLRSYAVYRVPALGESGFQGFIRDNIRVAE